MHLPLIGHRVLGDPRHRPRPAPVVLRTAHAQDGRAHGRAVGGARGGHVEHPQRQRPQIRPRIRLMLDRDGCIRRVRPWSGRWRRSDSCIARPLAGRAWCVSRNASTTVPIVRYRARVVICHVVTVRATGDSNYVQAGRALLTSRHEPHVSRWGWAGGGRGRIRYSNTISMTS